MEDYAGALDYYQQALRANQKVLGKTHPNTLGTIMNTVKVYMLGLKDSMKTEELYRRALNACEKSLGKDRERTKDCVYNLNILLRKNDKDKKDDALEEQYPESSS